jgi:hypothetical protein
LTLTHPRFSDYPEFLAAATPKEMLDLGVFGGCYFGAKTSPEFQDNTREFPQSWFADANLTNVYDAKVNCFEVRSGASKEWWQEKGLMHDDDPLGWFQWYCRFYNGRRHTDDVRQIRRWKNFRRWQTNILNSAKGQIDKRPVVRQSLLHWAYDPFI